MNLVAAVGGALVAVLGAVWVIDQHFVTRREFEQWTERIAEALEQLKESRS